MHTRYSSDEYRLTNVRGPVGPVVVSSRITLTTTNTLPWNSIVTYLRYRTISHPVLRYQCLYNWSNSAVIKSGEITAKKQ